MRNYHAVFICLLISCTSVSSLQFAEPDMQSTVDLGSVDSAAMQDLSCQDGPSTMTELPDNLIYKKYNKENCKCERSCINGTYDSCTIALKIPLEMNITEACNDLDDDCDGFIDEGAQPKSSSEQYSIISKNDGSWDWNCDLKVYMSLCNASVQPVQAGINKLHYFSTKNSYSSALGDSVCSTYLQSDCPNVMIYIDSREPTCGQMSNPTAQRAACIFDLPTMKCKAQTAVLAMGTTICCM